MGIDEHTSYLDEFNNLDVAGYAALHPALFAYVKNAMAQPGKQFLLVGDTDHDSESLDHFIRGPGLAALFNYAAIPHVAREMPREMFPLEQIAAFREKCGQYSQGLITAQERDEAQERFFADNAPDSPLTKRAILGMTKAGLRVTPADSAQWYDNASLNAERLFLGDREVAHYIRGMAGADKTAVVYGSGHFYYTDTMGSRFGRDKCVHVDIFPDRATYERHHKPQDRKFNPLHVDLMPDKVYILDERSLEDPDPAVFFSAPDKEDDRAQDWRDEVNYMYGPNPPMLAGLMTAEYLRPMRGMDPQWLTYVPEAA